jgi:hypothetical protein
MNLLSLGLPLVKPGAERMRANRSRPSFGSGYYTIKVRFVQTGSQVPVTSEAAGHAYGVTATLKEVVTLRDLR